MRGIRFIFAAVLATVLVCSKVGMTQTTVVTLPDRVMRPTQAANGDPRARIPEAIFAVNQGLAAKGNKDAAFQLGLAYMQGSGVAQDLAQAERWFLAGAVDPSDRTWIAGLYQNGVCFEKDAGRAAEWYELAGNSEGLFAAARLYQLGDGVPADLPMATDIYVELLGRTGDPYVRRAQMELGNLVIDGRYSSGDAKKDLEWARVIAQQLIGDEVYNLAWSSRGSAMDLPANPKVKASLLQEAAAYNIYSAQRLVGEQMLKKGDAEGYAWKRLAGQYDPVFGMKPDEVAALSPSLFAAGSAALAQLQETHQEAGAYYEASDPLRAPDMRELAKQVEGATDPDAELRLAYFYELNAGDPAAAAASMALYRKVRDERVAGVRLKLGTEYRLGKDGFPQDEHTAAAWYGFAAKAGSAEACRDLAEMVQAGLVEASAGCQH